MYTDSHCHITCDRLYGRIDEIIDHAKEAGISQMLIMCTSRKELERALFLKDQHPNLFKVAFGWFPGDARDVTKEDLEDLRKICREGKLDVLGEIGLDYYWDKSFNEEQKELFIKQLEIANEFRLPVSIHMRDASRDTMDILKKHAQTKIIFHCYSGSTETMKEALKLDSLISFAGPVTYKNNKTGPENIKACPLDRLLSETDAPYLAPVPKRGKENEPAFVQYTADRIAELKGISSEECQSQIEKNFQKLFERI
ncbi:MAG: TatD family hydrolase [Erysipelotrichaceae bacterium]|nr:TatD family hydrolase [Erysipelotrichaceae bacterium]